MYVIAFFVAVSVVLVKQHYIADAVAGCLVAWVSYVWEFREKPFSIPKPLVSRVISSSEN